ncbi:hypothetical protein DL766_007590 [Monosporascus sp. MC13-8B]|uniref:Transmembrane protein n=1 Tax=Monosporascus cannonballus TaxID=155416 RepID=A0ABY0HIS3_9PEZI|nr:hypothetical protein DL763_011574 [Monosporascus cannonballus]RYO91533.1 hypothetical protein DL762_002147 [Monosporascus cannonballus]RYP22970.1 hypothetical protein DL766_007590 [Monosporascus sp. MC13-8B]
MFSFLKHLSILLMVLLFVQAAPFSQGTHHNSTDTEPLSRRGISDTSAMPTIMQTIQRMDTDATDDCLGLHRRSESTPWLTHRAPFGRKGGKGSHSDCAKPSKTARKLPTAVIAGIVLGSVLGLSALAVITTLIYKILTRDGRGAEAEAKRLARQARSERVDRARAALQNVDFVRKETKETRNTKNVSA